MGYFTLIKSIFYFISLFSTYQSQVNGPVINEQKAYKHEPIENIGGECDFCYDQLVATCCCKVTLNQLPSIDLYICGVYNGHNNTDCNMDTGDDCYDVQGTQGVHRTLSYGSPIYFCIEKGNPFTLCNGNGSGEGFIWVDCNSSGVPSGGQYGINLSYTTGGWCRYIQSDSSCDLEFCDF